MKDWKKKLKEKDLDLSLEKEFPKLPDELRKKILSYIEDYFDSKEKPPN